MASNMKAVRNRIRSVQNTMQITKAMELVASSKLRKARDKAVATSESFKVLRETLHDIANNNRDFMSPYTRESESERWCYVVIAGDRGLAGGYNSNLFKRFEREARGKEYSVIPIGKKAVEYFERRGTDIVTRAFSCVSDVTVSDCFELAALLCEEYKKGSYGHMALYYTRFDSMLTQTPKKTAMLPLSDFIQPGHDVDQVRNLILYKPSPEEVFNAIVPEYLTTLIYCGISDSVASELAARRTAMEAATDNASEMIAQLELSYNRARQASITQEITEIIAGSEGR